MHRRTNQASSLPLKRAARFTGVSPKTTATRRLSAFREARFRLRSRNSTRRQRSTSAGALAPSPGSQVPLLRKRKRNRNRPASRRGNEVSLSDDKSNSPEAAGYAT